MAIRGRKPAPTALKILEGVRESRINAAEPPRVAGLPDCPGHLDDTAREEWDRIAPLLDQLGVLSRTDGSALALYCSAFSRWQAAGKEVKAKGLLIHNEKTGVTKANPAVAIQAAAGAVMHRLLVEFGCTPSSRSRLGSAGESPRDELSDFQAKWQA